MTWKIRLRVEYAGISNNDDQSSTDPAIVGSTKLTSLNVVEPGT